MTEGGSQVLVETVLTPRINYPAEVGFRFDDHFQIVSTAIQLDFIETRGRDADVHSFRYITSPQF